MPRRRHFRNCRCFIHVAFLRVPTDTGMAGVLFRILATVTAFAISHRKTSDSNRDAEGWRASCSRSARLSSFLKNPGNCHHFRCKSTSSHRDGGCPAQSPRDCHRFLMLQISNMPISVDSRHEPDTSPRKHTGRRGRGGGGSACKQ